MNYKDSISAAEESILRAKTFATIFSVSFSVSYVIADIYKAPIFSYYPATHLVNLGWTPSTPDDGPAMYWYGWLLTSFIVAMTLSFLSKVAPISIVQRIPSSISWIVPVALIPVMIFSLKFYWR